MPYSVEKLLALIQAILTRAREREGYVTKTKLVKYLYLIDLAHYRKQGSLLTGFPWVFHYYGPWAEEFESLYQQAARTGRIRVRPGSRPELDTEFLDTPERVDLSEVIEDTMLGLEVRHIVDMWADRRLGEMLDHVYFNTEPMEGASRGQPLDFTAANRRGVPMAPWQPNRGDRRLAERLRQRVRERLGPVTGQSPEPFTPPRYDEEYARGLRIMDADEGD